MKIYRLYDEHKGEYVNSYNGRSFWSNVGHIKTMWKTSQQLKYSHELRNLTVQEFETKHIDSQALEDII